MVVYLGIAKVLERGWIISETFSETVPRVLGAPPEVSETRRDEVTGRTRLEK